MDDVEIPRINLAGDDDAGPDERRCNVSDIFHVEADFELRGIIQGIPAFTDLIVDLRQERFVGLSAHAALYRADELPFGVVEFELCHIIDFCNILKQDFSR